MAWWRRDRDSARRRAARRRGLEFDVMEGRLLLSTVPGPRAVALRAAAVEKARRAAVSTNTTASANHVTVAKQVAFAVNTYASGRTIANSPIIRKLGLSFAKVAVSRDARKVGLAYARALIRGNGHTIHELNHTRLVQQVGNDFSKLGKSPLVKRVGNAFARFGRSVADEFNRLFLHKSSSSKTK